jgi:hypothetical protein
VSQAHPVRVLVVGDPYMPAGIFASALAGLGDTAGVTELQLGSPEAPPRTDSERALREHMGDPASIRYLVAAGQHATSVYEGREFIGSEASSTTLGLIGLNPEIAAHKEAAS